MMSNLIDNAMKFGPPTGRVTLLLVQECDAAVVTVTDEGPGVPAAERPLVTQRFYRARHDREGADRNATAPDQAGALERIGHVVLPLHELLQDHYEGVTKYAGEVAERLQGIGVSSDGLANTIVRTSCIPEYPGGFVEHAIDKYQWQMRAMIQSTPTDPNTGADLNNGRQVVPAGRPSAPVN